MPDAKPKKGRNRPSKKNSSGKKSAEKKIQRDIQRNIERIAKAPPEGAGYSCFFSFNRELSWIEFNRKVLEEAMDPSNPSLEQLKFLSIFYNNLDLADPACIDALYRTSRSGVDVRLQVRGICCLRPGIPGFSGNIVVTSLVGRYLEHARIYYFGGRGESEMFIGSADLMPRNLDGRVEVPVLEDILLLHMGDNRKQRRLKADGTCERISPGPGEPRIDSRQLMMKRESGWNPPPTAILR